MCNVEPRKKHPTRTEQHFEIVPGSKRLEYPFWFRIVLGNLSLWCPRNKKTSQDERTEDDDSAMARGRQLAAAVAGCHLQSNKRRSEGNLLLAK